MSEDKILKIAKILNKQEFYLGRKMINFILGFLSGIGVSLSVALITLLIVLKRLDKLEKEVRERRCNQIKQE